jgi:hypothetical protein
MAYIKLFFASNDEQVSEDQSNPVSFTLRADLEEDDEVRLYAEADAGYSVDDVEVDPTGASAEKWALAPDDNESPGTYGADGALLALGTVGEGAGGRVHFWARAKATDDEDPVNDETVTLEVTGVAEAV